LQVEKENTRAAEARARGEEVSVYQTEMLARQELIAVRTKRDNTVMKVIAVLTALFLPGTFIAVSNLPRF
jgi:Mg2+ and Co2+ transporter CorA